MNEGDVVKLRSGGPMMTVKAIQGVAWTVCVWFDDKAQYHEQAFLNESLVMERPLTKPPSGRP